MTEWGGCACRQVVMSVSLGKERPQWLNKLDPKKLFRSCRLQSSLRYLFANPSTNHTKCHSHKMSFTNRIGSVLKCSVVLLPCAVTQQGGLRKVIAMALPFLHAHACAHKTTRAFSFTCSCCCLLEKAVVIKSLLNPHPTRCSLIFRRASPSTT